MNKPTMTLMEVYTDLKKYGFRTSPSKLSKGIASGLFPFGKVLNVGETGRRSIQILRVDYESWKDEFVIGKIDSMAKPSNPFGAISPDPHTKKRLISTQTYIHEDKDTILEITIQRWLKNTQ